MQNIMERVRSALAMSPEEQAEAEAIVARYSPAQVQEAIDYTLARAARPNWPYLRRVLVAKKRRLTMADYASFSEATKGKLDRFPFAWTSFESDLSEMPAWARRAVEGVERRNMSDRGQG